MLLLSGKARVGKTTAAKILSEQLYLNGYKPIILPFAAALKAEVEATGITKENNPEEYRLTCQERGSARRNEDQDYWVNKFIEAVKIIAKEEHGDPDNCERAVIVDDCRYLNELNLAPRFNALKIFVAHDSRQLQDHDAEWRKHESEQMAASIEDGNKDLMSTFHFVVKNSGTEKEFKTKLKDMFQVMVDCAYAIVVDNLCECELCLSTRYDRPVCIDKLEKQILDQLTTDFEEEEKKKENE